jgi:hypothetical protein
VVDPSPIEGEASATAEGEESPAGAEDYTPEKSAEEQAIVTDASTEDVEMAEVGNSTLETVTEVSTEVDVEMVAGSSSQPLKSTLTSTPPSTSNAPSRQPTPPPKSKPPTTAQSKLTPITSLRHTICHCGSLLSLSLCPSGK